MGGWNTKSVMSPNLLVVDRNKQAGASPCDRAALPYHSYSTTIPPVPLPLLYHKYHFYIAPLSFHSSLCWAPLVHAADRCERMLAIVRPSPAGVRITLFP